MPPSRLVRASDALNPSRTIAADRSFSAASPSIRYERSTTVIFVGLLLTAITALFAISDGGDDAYIPYRYVIHWLDGRGLTFNHGEAVEGFTSLSWVVVLAFITWLTGLPVASVSVLVNYLLLPAIALVLERTLRAAGANVAERAVALGVFGTSFSYFQLSFLGLESALFGLLLTVFGGLLASIAGGVKASVRQRFDYRFIALGLTGGLLAATRPETVVLVPVVLVALYVLNEQRRRRALFSSAVAYVTVVGGVFLWRQLQYGEWLPNSVIAKSISLNDPNLSNMIEQRLGDGVTYLRDAYATFPQLALITLVAVIMGITGALSRRSLLLLLPLVLAHALVLENGGDWMPQFRLLTMYWPLWLLAAWSLSVDAQRRYGRLAMATAVVVLVLHGVATVRAITSTEHFALQASVVDGRPVVNVADGASINGFSFAYETVGRALGAVWMREDVLAAESVGRLGYVAPDVFIHDPTGLTERTLAHDPTAAKSVYGRMNWRYTMSVMPAVVLLHYWPHQREWASFGVGYPEQFDRFCLRPPFYNSDPFTLYIVVRKDRPGYSIALRDIGAQPLEDRAGQVRCGAGP